MKYLLAGLIISTVQILFIVAVALGAMYFGVANVLSRMRKASRAETETR